jgi:hypothetical protein
MRVRYCIKSLEHVAVLILLYVCIILLEVCIHTRTYSTSTSVESMRSLLSTEMTDYATNRSLRNFMKIAHHIVALDDFFETLIRPSAGARTCLIVFPSVHGLINISNKSSNIAWNCRGTVEGSVLSRNIDLRLMRGPKRYCCSLYLHNQNNSRGVFP